MSQIGYRDQFKGLARHLSSIEPVDEDINCFGQLFSAPAVALVCAAQVLQSTSSSGITPSLDSFHDPFRAFLKYSEWFTRRLSCIV